MKKTEKSIRIQYIFAETAKDIIIENGITAISVRKIADRAGYVIGTLYNHFKNLDELLWMTRSIIIQDIADYLNYGDSPIPGSIEDIIIIFQKYAQYFIDYPEIYKFLYFRSLNQNDKKNENITESQNYNLHLTGIWTNLIEKKVLNQNQVLRITKVIIYSIHGLLTIALSNNDQIKTGEIREEIEMIIRELVHNK